MIFLQDHIISIMIGGLVMLIMATVYLDGQEAGVEITMQYSGRVNALNLIEMVQRDFSNIGSGVDTADPMILDYVWNATTKYIEFRGVVDTAATAPVELLRYQVVFVDSAQINFNDSLQTVALFEVQRLVDDAGTYRETGVSASTIREFDVSLLNATGSSVGGAFNDTRQIEVRMVALPSAIDTRINRHNYWQTRIRPPNLTLKDP